LSFSRLRIDIFGIVYLSPPDLEWPTFQAYACHTRSITKGECHG
jgi:hypothetical protein